MRALADEGMVVAAPDHRDNQCATGRAPTSFPPSLVDPRNWSPSFYEDRRDDMRRLRAELHRSIERQPSHSKLVKKVLSTQCMGCDLRMEAVYGPAATGMVDAHHLTPLSSLADGSVVTFDPRNDFAVLCPSCHRFIHRMPDSGDDEGLRKAVARGRGLTS